MQRTAGAGRYAPAGIHSERLAGRVAEVEERAASRAKGFQSLRQICKARGLDYAKVRPALYNKQAVNDRPWHVEVLKAFCGEG